MNNWLKTLLKKLKLNEPTISMILGVLVIVVIGVLIFNYFRGIGQPEEAELLPAEETAEEGEEKVALVEEAGELVPENLPATHSVAQGEHLWVIAEKYYGSGYNWVDIAEKNNLSNPNLLAIDQELVIPKVSVKQPASDPQINGEVLGKAAVEEKYTVAKGDNLWVIAMSAYGDGFKWTEIAQTNNLENPDLIHSGNTLTLPR